jgi:hypothetical protein
MFYSSLLLCLVLGDNFLRDHVVGSSRGCPLLQLNFRKSDLLILYNGGPDLIPILPEPEIAFPGGSTCGVCTPLAKLTTRQQHTNSIKTSCCFVMFSCCFHVVFVLFCVVKIFQFF